MAREIYYVRLTIRQMKFSRTKKFHTMFLENRPCFLILKERELLFTSLRHDIKFRFFTKKNLLIYLMIKFRSIYRWSLVALNK